MKPEYNNKYGPALALGTNIAAGMVLCSLGGYYLDKKIGNDSSYLTLSGMFLGLFYSGYEVWKVVRNLNQKD